MERGFELMPTFGYPFQFIFRMLVKNCKLSMSYYFVFLNSKTNQKFENRKYLNNAIEKRGYFVRTEHTGYLSLPLYWDTQVRVKDGFSQ